jgi:hypothetical protein
MPFITKLNLQDNRQHRLPSREIHNLSGITEFGVTFSGLTSGPDLTTSGVTNNIININSTFSGNSIETNFTFGAFGMGIAEDKFTPITSSNSATTQDSGNVYVGNTSQTIDGNLVYLNYSGVSFEIDVTSIDETSPGIYTGTVTSNDVFYLSAGTLDYTGRTIWSDVKGIHRTEDIIVSNNPVLGYVLTSDSEGKGTWQPPVTGGSSTNTFTTGGTLNGTNAYFDTNTSLSAYTLDLSALSDTTFWSAGTGTNAITAKNHGSTASANDAVSWGDNATASGNGSTAFGNSTIASGNSSHAQGNNTTASGLQSHAQGLSTLASGRTSHAEGEFTIASGVISHAEGSGTTASGDYSHAQGVANIASGFAAHVEGVGNISSGNQSHAEGAGTTASNDTSHAEGFNTLASGNYAHAEGEGTSGTSRSCHAEGKNTLANNLYAHAEGSGTIASGHVSHAEGSSVASGDYSHGQGLTTTASGVAAHAEGSFTVASASASHAEGSFTLSSGNQSHAEGQTTTANGISSHAEGSFTVASGSASHAEGQNTEASGQVSHAQGQQTIASGNWSHAEGNGTLASGTGSHAEGQSTVASGDYSHAGGNWSHSSAEGGIPNRVIASGRTSFAHFSNQSASDLGVYSDYSAILGGTNNHITTGATNSVILGGTGITADTSDTVYVPDLVINGLTSTDPIATDADGRIVAGTSDRRLKQNIKPLSGGVDKVKALRGVSFEYTEESNMGKGLRYGFIAQEVQDVIPEIVRGRSKDDGMLTLSYTEVIPWLVEAVKDIVNGNTIIEDTLIKTQTIAAEDNSIELNFNGTHDSSTGGGISIKNGVNDGIDSFIKIDENGKWIVGPSLTTGQLTLPEYTPTSSNDSIGDAGDVVWDDTYMYIKTNNGWRRTNLEEF